MENVAPWLGTCSQPSSQQTELKTTPPPIPANEEALNGRLVSRQPRGPARRFSAVFSPYSGNLSRTWSRLKIGSWRPLHGPPQTYQRSFIFLVNALFLFVREKDTLFKEGGKLLKVCNFLRSNYRLSLSAPSGLPYPVGGKPT